MKMYLNGMKKYLQKIINLFLLFSPTQNNTVLFNSFNGQYSDNPKYISEKLHSINNKIDIIWTVSSKSKENSLPEYINTVTYLSYQYFKYLYRAQVVVDNYAGLRVSHACSSFINNYLKTLKRKKQYNISTWHGTPLKKMGIDEPEFKNTKINFQTCSDYVLAGNRFTALTLQRIFQNHLPVKLIGTPRNDVFFDSTIDYFAIKRRLDIPLDKKIVLFAPTFRNNVELSGLGQMQMFDFDSILNAFSDRFGGDWLFIFRFHDNVLLKIDENIYKNNISKRIISGNKGDDMAEYLLCSDVLITDYSSSMFDFALTKKPCFLFAPDRAFYEKQERGFYIDYDSLPFPKSYSCDQLIESIDLFDNEIYKKGIDKLLNDLGSVEDGQASLRVAMDIINFIKTGRKSLMEGIHLCFRNE